MPTVLLIDSSLSMCKTVNVAELPEPIQYRHLINDGLSHLLNAMAMTCKLEFCSLVVFSSLYELVEPFTRDYERLKEALLRFTYYDSSFVDVGLEGAKHVITHEWGTSMASQVILVTEGGSRSSKFRAHLETVAAGSAPLFSFPAKLHIICMAPYKDNLPLYQKIIDRAGGGSLITPELPLSMKGVQQMFTQVAETNYSSFVGTLQCGHLTSSVTLCPPPETVRFATDFESHHVTMSDVINIVGFLEIADVANPPTVSRHLVLPVAITKKEEASTAAGNNNGVVASGTVAGTSSTTAVGTVAGTAVTPAAATGTTSALRIDVDTGAEVSDGDDEGRQPSFCVLLHGSLKVANMVALCQLAPSWFGIMFSWADNKKKSNLMLATFEPGVRSVPWLGNLTHLGPKQMDSAVCLGIERVTLPIHALDKRSYAQNMVIWIRQSGLHADVQKILRHARKLPEKLQNFYKELNRFRRAALAIGFYEMLDLLGTILERECTSLPGTAHPEALLQLSHAAALLRMDPREAQYNEVLIPLKTKFNG